MDAAAVLGFALACPSPTVAFGVAFSALWFRAVYGSTRRVVLHGAGTAAGIARAAAVGPGAGARGDRAGGPGPGRAPDHGPDRGGGPAPGAGPVRPGAGPAPRRRASPAGHPVVGGGRPGPDPGTRLGDGGHHLRRDTGSARSGR